MKTGSQINRYVFIALLMVAFLLSCYIAFITYRNYGIIARGIVGIVLIYQLLLWRGNSDIAIDSMLLDPKKGKYIVYALTIPMISYWAAAQVYEMILFFSK